jgi:hypothetical protein
MTASPLPTGSTLPMESEPSSHDGLTNRDPEEPSESAALLDRPASPEMGRSAKERLLIYALPALLLW